MPTARDLTGVLLLFALDACAAPKPAAASGGDGRPESVTVSVPPAAFPLELVGIPAIDGRAPIRMSKTEITWDLYDAFVYFDEPDPATPDHADGITRPTKPYISYDRGFGHAGYPALGMTFKSAEAFCTWLSAKTGRRFRLPTEAEWESACRTGAKPPASDAELGAIAWYKDNADSKTHPVATKRANAWGLHDITGNVAEWCFGEDGQPVACGGSFRDAASAVGASARVRPTPEWNRSDPQIPKSTWWLADCNFVGLRVVCEP